MPKCLICGSTFTAAYPGERFETGWKHKYFCGPRSEWDFDLKTRILAILGEGGTREEIASQIVSLFGGTCSSK